MNLRTNVRTEGRNLRTNQDKSADGRPESADKTKQRRYFIFIFSFLFVSDVVTVGRRRSVQLSLIVNCGACFRFQKRLPTTEGLKTCQPLKA